MSLFLSNYLTNGSIQLRLTFDIRFSSPLTKNTRTHYTSGCWTAWSTLLVREGLWYTCWSAEDCSLFCLARSWFKRSSATCSILALTQGNSSSTSWKSLALKTKVSHMDVATTLATRRAFVKRQISRKGLFGESRLEKQVERERKE